MMTDTQRTCCPGAHPAIYSRPQQILDGLGMIKVFMADQAASVPRQAKPQLFPQCLDRQSRLEKQGGNTGGLDDVGIAF